jgi:hypothetical protein
MSNQEIRIGKIKPIEFSSRINGTFKSKVSWLKRNKFKFDDVDYDNENIYSEQVVKYGDEWYEVIEDNEYNDVDLSETFYNDDGTISYLLGYYNGGCCFEEALGHALGKGD